MPSVFGSTDGIHLFFHLPIQHKTDGNGCGCDQKKQLPGKTGCDEDSCRAIRTADDSDTEGMNDCCRFHGTTSADGIVVDDDIVIRQGGNILNFIAVYIDNDQMVAACDGIDGGQLVVIHINIA